MTEFSYLSWSPWSSGLTSDHYLLVWKGNGVEKSFHWMRDGVKTKNGDKGLCHSRGFCSLLTDS